jgi:hypothetical protein
MSGIVRDLGNFCLQALTRLDMRQNQNVGAGAASLFCTIQNQLQHLDLSSCGLEKPGFVQLCKQWAACANKCLLSHLSFAGSDLSGLIPDTLAAALQANRQLVALDMSCCHLGNQCGRRLLALAESIKYSKLADGKRHQLQVSITLDASPLFCGSHIYDMLMPTELFVWQHCVTLFE